MQTPLNDAIKAVVAQNRVRMHVPFHAGRAFASESAQMPDWPWQADLTELPPLDVLGNPQGVLKASQAEVAQLYGVEQSFYLVNGASVGLMAALLACGLTENDTVLVARNAHRAVVHGLVLCGAKPLWVLPQQHAGWGVWGAVTVDALEAALKKTHTQPKALLITHPTYEGIGSDMASIVAWCQRKNILLIVDEAHGSLWPLFDELPMSAVQPGVDAVIHSLHKSGGSLTQGALLHLPKSSQLKAGAVQESLNLLQTTSPSYSLLANMETTLAYWDCAVGQRHLNDWMNQTLFLRTWISQSLQTIEAWQTSQSKGFQLLLRSTVLDGEALATALEDTHDISFESFTDVSVLLVLNAGLDAAALEQLKTALLAIDTHCRTNAVHKPIESPTRFHIPQMAMTPRQAFFHPGEPVLAQDALGKISKQIIATCPPGIPILMPGEVVQMHHLAHLPVELNVTII